MKEKTDFNKIRELLERWYSGLSSPEEERMLSELLDSAPMLPPDLEADRQLFSGFAFVVNAIPEMPEEYSMRINEALEKEISSDKKRVVPVAMSVWYRKWISGMAAGVAICLAIAFFAIKMIDTPKLVVRSGENTAMHQGMNGVKVSDDTLKNHYLALNSQREITSASVNESARKNVSKPFAGKEKKNKITRSIDEVYSTHSYGEGDYDMEDDRYLSHTDEAMLARDNYRVVRDQNEADAIINSIFSRLESNVAMETSKLSKIELEYDSEMSRLSDIENVGLLKDYYHEKTPL